MELQEEVYMFTKDYLRSKYYYSDGSLYHKSSSNHIKVGSKAGYARSDGYIGIKVDGKPYLSHRIIYAYFNDYMPEFIDHANGDRADNRIENLRAATVSQNQMNKQLYKNSSTGVKGVSFVAESNKFRCRVQKDGKRFFVGDYDTIIDAKIAVDKFRKEAHGEFSRGV